MAKKGGAGSLYRSIRTRYGEMTVFANDTGAVARSLFAYGEWAENELSFLSLMIPSGATVIDVGAYIGTHTLAFSKFVGPLGRVIAIEPQNKTFELLTENVAANRLANVELLHAAAAERIGTLEILAIDPSSQGSFGSAALAVGDGNLGGDLTTSQRKQNPISVDLLTIDSLELAGCALIKIDAEGTEDLVIRGAKRTIRHFSPAIYAECNSVEGGLKTAAAMRELGCAVRMHVVDAFSESNFCRNSENIFESAREVALVGLAGALLEKIDRASPRPCELILKIESTDDLVLGLLNKPQYPGEILSAGSAARTGGDAFLKRAEELRSDHARLANEIDWAKGELSRAHQRAAAAEVEHQRVGNELAWTKDELAKARESGEALEIERQRLKGELTTARQRADASQALAEASMRQARFAREAADRAEATAVELAQQNQLLNRRLEGIEASTAWQATSILRAWAARMPPPLRVALRRTAKAAYWGLTPHKMPARLRFLRNRRRARTLSRHRARSTPGRRDDSVPKASQQRSTT